MHNFKDNSSFFNENLFTTSILEGIADVKKSKAPHLLLRSSQIRKKSNKTNMNTNISGLFLDHRVRLLKWAYVGEGVIGKNIIGAES